ncbi:testican-3 isoform X2 [Esox lucius]|uniref:testican-3 isoform X2 n=1 Tax=Esox lucius TaxID=8010 RepID=UPI00147768A0|nr:testican-3 isoform X2 [Esox lucius]
MRATVRCLARRERVWVTVGTNGSRQTKRVASMRHQLQNINKMLSVAVLCVCAIAGGVSARSDSGNFLDDKWLTARWDKFRDEPGTWNPGKPFDKALNPAKDPCLKIKCSRHKVCVAEDDQTATCVSQRRVSMKEPSLSLSPQSHCERCPVVHPSPVCGTDQRTYPTKVTQNDRHRYPTKVTQNDRHRYPTKVTQNDRHRYPTKVTQNDRHRYPTKVTQNDRHRYPTKVTQNDRHRYSTKVTQNDRHRYSTKVTQNNRQSYPTKCKLDYQACVSGKQISVKCSGQCPCQSVQPEYSTAEKTDCSESDLKEVVGRLRDWFRVLHENGDNKKIKIHKPLNNKFSQWEGPICKDPIGWMFSRLDTNSDLLLDQSELSRLGLDRKEGCSDTLFTSCDTHSGTHSNTLLLSSAEWCTCFQKYTDTPCRSELTSINKKQAGKKLLGQYLPVCDVEGYYQSHQCHSSSGQCWCVDRYGNEVAGSRTHGVADCGVVLESSGDQSSGDSHFSDDDDEDFSFVLNDQPQVDDEDDEDDYEGEEGYLS